MRILICLLLLLSAPLAAQPSIHPGGPAAAPRHPPTDPRAMDAEERQEREEAADWLIIRLGGGIGIGVLLLGGAVVIGQIRRRKGGDAA